MENRDWGFRKKLDILDKEYLAKIETAETTGFVGKNEKNP
jgi:hypothetical protein